MEPPLPRAIRVDLRESVAFLRTDLTATLAVLASIIVAAVGLVVVAVVLGVAGVLYSLLSMVAGGDLPASEPAYNLVRLVVVLAYLAAPAALTALYVRRTVGGERVVDRPGVLPFVPLSLFVLGLAGLRFGIGVGLASVVLALAGVSALVRGVSYAEHVSVLSLGDRGQALLLFVGFLPGTAAVAGWALGQVSPLSDAVDPGVVGALATLLTSAGVPETAEVGVSSVPGPYLLGVVVPVIVGVGYAAVQTAVGLPERGRTVVPGEPEAVTRNLETAETTVGDASDARARDDFGRSMARYSEASDALDDARSAADRVGYSGADDRIDRESRRVENDAADALQAAVEDRADRIRGRLEEAREAAEVGDLDTARGRYEDAIDDVSDAEAFLNDLAEAGPADLSGPDRSELSALAEEIREELEVVRSGDDDRDGSKLDRVDDLVETAQRRHAEDDLEGALAAYTEADEVCTDARRIAVERGLDDLRDRIAARRADVAEARSGVIVDGVDDLASTAESHRDAGNYTAALESYRAALDRCETAVSVLREADADPESAASRRDRIRGAIGETESEYARNEASEHLDAATDRVEEGDRHLEDEDYEAALDAYEAARERQEAALEQATEYDLALVEEAERRLERAERGIEQAQLSRIADTITDASGHLDDGDHEAARRLLETAMATVEGMEGTADRVEDLDLLRTEAREGVLRAALAALRDELSRAIDLYENDQNLTAVERFDDTEARLERIRDRTTDDDFSSLATEAESLLELCRDDAGTVRDVRFGVVEGTPSLRTPDEVPEAETEERTDDLEAAVWDATPRAVAPGDSGSAATGTEGDDVDATGGPDAGTVDATGDAPGSGGIATDATGTGGSDTGPTAEADATDGGEVPPEEAATDPAGEVAAGDGEAAADTTGGEEAADATPAADTADATGETDAGAVDSNPKLANRMPDFERLERLGEGEWAAVERIQLQGGTVAVVRRSIPGKSYDDDALREFASAATTWDDLSENENVAELADWGGAPSPWLLVEDLPGSLADREEAFDLATAVSVLTGTCDAVARAHEDGITHTDLRPPNVLLTDENDARVTDWGVIHTLFGDEGGVYARDPRYAAPEQIDSHAYGDPGERTDVYQVGVLAYEALTGRPPFEGDSAGAIAAAVTTEDPTPPSELADLPTEVDDVVFTAMARDPDDRYDDVEALRDDLADLV